jgi:NAD(P)-dependent dehydrogenase (short-subunit alcohol dehydrogenase family)
VFTIGLAREVAGEAIRVNAVRRPGTAQEVANAILWLVSDEASYLHRIDRRRRGRALNGTADGFRCPSLLAKVRVSETAASKSRRELFFGLPAGMG